MINMNGVEISIIVPVYNVEKYIERCLESLINQTFKNIEIILINDGSTDLSKEICERYAKQDKRIILINQQNKGQSAARNKGIEIARGNYIGFVDSDDYVELTMYEKMREAIINNDVEIVNCQKNVYSDNGSLVQDKSEKIIRKVENSKDSIVRILKTNEWALWDKLYKKEVFKDFLFMEGVSYGEDFSAIIPILGNVKEILIIEDGLYNYIRREGSTSNSKFNKKFFDVVYVWEKVVNDAKNINIEIEKLAQNNLFEWYINILNSGLFNNYNKYEKEVGYIVNKIKKERYKFYFKSNFNLKTKLVCLFVKFNFEIYKLLYMKVRRV